MTLPDCSHSVGKQVVQTGIQPITILIIAASARAFAHCIVRSRNFDANSKLNIIAADLFLDADTQQTCSAVQVAHYPNDFIAIAERVNPDFVVYSGGLENHEEVIGTIEQNSTILGNGREVLAKLQDKAKLFEILNDSGFKAPKNHFSVSEIKKPGLPLVESWLKKNFKSCGGLGVQEIDNKACKTWSPSTLSEYFFQEKIIGESYSAIFVATKDDSGKSHSHWLGTSIQLTGDRRFNASSFLYTGSIISNQLTPTQEGQLESIGQLIAERFGLIGLFNIDFIKRNDGLYFIEINPRFSASMELLDRATNNRIFDLHFNACLGRKIDVDGHIYTPDLQRFGKAVWYADQDYLISQSFFNFVRSENARSVEQSGFPIIADIPVPDTRIKNGEPVFTVFASDQSEMGVDEKLVKAATMFASRLNN